MALTFTGEYFIPGHAPKRVEDDHMERYRFAARFVLGRTVLDIACGVGFGSRLLAEAGARRVDGVDISPQVIDYARAHYGSERAVFTVGDIASFSAPEPYDVVVCFETIEHVTDHLAALRNLARLVRKGGVLLLSTPNRLITSPHARSMADAPANRFHVREFTIAEITAALRDAEFAVAGDGVFGQRQQPYFANRYLRAIYRRLWNPDLRASPRVTPVTKLAPRYIVVVAHKPGR